MMSLSDDKQADIIYAFNTTTRYLDNILNISNAYFDTMVSQIYSSELQLIKLISLIPKPRFFRKSRSDVDGLTHTKQLLNLLCIVYFPIIPFR